MDKWANEVSGEVVGIVVFIMIIGLYLLGVFIASAVMTLVTQGYQLYKQRDQTLQLDSAAESGEARQHGPTSASSEASRLGWDAGLRMGAAIPWQ